MITSTENRATIGRVMALGFLLATLMAMLLSAAPAGAAAPSDKAFGWGYNYSGQLGNGTGGFGTDTNTPTAVSNLESVKSVKAGCSHGLALLENGTIRAWGDNFYGQLGNGKTATDSNVPVKVKNLTDVKAISAGCDHNLALKVDGTVWAWGYNGSGELGNGTNGPGTDSNVPVQVGSLGTGAKGIAAGHNFSLALMQDGTVNSWGSNGNSQLGNGTDTPFRNTPGPVRHPSNVKAIATDSSARHALALLNDGTVIAWGNNSSDQLGNGASGNGADSTEPVAVTNLAGVKSVATGGYHSLALLGSGKVKSWGFNFYGQLGNGASGPNTDRSTPTDVIGLSNVRSISGGTYHSLAVLESGKARSWGDNYSGELGNGTTGTNRNTPGAVKNLSNVKNIDGGGAFTLAATTE